MKKVAIVILALAAGACTANTTPENGAQGCGPVEDPCASGFYCAPDRRCWERGTGPGDGMGNLDADAPTLDSGIADTRPPDPDTNVVTPDKCTGPAAAMIGTPCSVGAGACARTGTYQCLAGTPPMVACGVAPGVEVIEICNGLDDDCNGATDNGVVPIDCALSQGVCAGTKQKCGGAGGWTACKAADYGSDYQADESLCDAKDNDCDGQTDEAQPTVNTVCNVGTGECARQGTHMCNGAKNGTECSVKVGPAVSESCNGKDDDCNGTTDNGFECPLGTADEACSACNGAFSGLRTCTAGCAWQACSRFVFADVVYDDNWTPFNHPCGRNCQGDICATESDTPTDCYLIDGGSPRAVPPGKYEVSWNIVDAGVFDFYVMNGGNILTSNANVNTGALTSPYVIQTFTVSGCAQIEFRLLAHAGARTRIYNITLKRTGEP